MRSQSLIAAMILLVGSAMSWAEGLKNVIPRNQKPILRTFRPSTVEQGKPGDGKFVIFTREKVGTMWDFIAGAWECSPSFSEKPITKRVEFCHSSWEADALLNVLVRDDSEGMHPRFVRLQVDSDDGYSVNLYDINYLTWDVRCVWQGSQLSAFGVMGGSIYCESSDGWLLIDTVSGGISRSVPLTPIATDGKYWLVRKPGETKGCWSYDRVKQDFIAHFESVEIPEVGFSKSKLSPDGRNRAWVVASMPRGWGGGKIGGRLILQNHKGKGDVSVPIEMHAVRGSGFPVIPVYTDLSFPANGRVEFRAGRVENETEDKVWVIDIESGNVSSATTPHVKSPVPELATLGGVPVPDYLRYLIDEFDHFGRSGLAPAFLLHFGIIKEKPEFPDCTAGVSPDGRHILFAPKKGPLSGFYIYGDLVTKQIKRWKAPDGLNHLDSQDFVWVENTGMK